MSGDKGPRLRDFLKGSLARWALGLACLVGEAEEPEEPDGEEEEGEGRPGWEKNFLRLSDGALLLRVLGIIAPSSRGGLLGVRDHEDPIAWRVRNLSHLWGRLRDFYQEELQLLILRPPPDLQNLGFDPFSEEAMETLEGVLRLLLGAAVQCEHRELFIRHIQGLSLEVQSELAAAIQEVTQPGTGEVLALAGPEPGELAAPELELLSRNLMGTLLRLARERDLGAQRLAELLLERKERESAPLLPEAPARTPQEGPSHHLALQLANTKAQLRRLRQELEEKAEVLLDSQAEVQGLEAEIRKLRQEAQALSGQAKRAELYREEAEALRERAGRLPRLQDELRRCRERLQAAESYKGRLEEEQLLSEALEASKVLLEEQLEATRERASRLHETQRENLLLRTRLGEAQSELDSLRHQVDQLAEENVELELELQRSLELPPNSPGEAPPLVVAPSLQDEVREAEGSRLRSLELENQQLRGLLRTLQGQSGVPLHPLLAESEEPGLDTESQTCLTSDPNSQDSGTPVEKGTQASDLAAPALDSALEGFTKCPLASQSDLPKLEKSLQVPKLVHQNSAMLTPHKPDAPKETQESLDQASTEDPPQTLASRVPHQGPEIQVQTPLSPERETGESGPRDPAQDPSKAQEPRLEEDIRDPNPMVPEHKPEGDPQAQALEEPVPGEILAGGDSEQELEALREEVAHLRNEAETLRAALETQARRLEARGSEAARLLEELAEARRLEAEAHREAETQARELGRLREAVEAAGREQEAASREREALAEALAAAGRERRQWEREGPRLRVRAQEAEERLQSLEKEAAQHLEEASRERREKQTVSEELEKATLRGQELGARLERLQDELDQASLERQEFLQQQACQHQRYQGLEQRLQAELQAAATSKEEALRELKDRALQLEEELFQLRQNPTGLRPEDATGRILDVQNGRLIEVERSNATLVAEKMALQGQLQHLEGQLGSLQGRAQDLLLQSQRAQEHSSRLQAEKSALETQGQELHRKLGMLEEEVRAAKQAQEETRGQQQALLQDHEALVQLQRRQEAELEGLLIRHRDLKANMRALELAHRELQGRHEQLQAQKASVESQEVALLAERERLVQDGHRQRGLEEELRRLQTEHDRAQTLLAEVSRERGELQGERGELRGRLARLELERAQLEAQSQRLRESNQQLDLSACRLTTQCELLTELRSAQEEENRQLLAEVQALSRENRALLERSLESRDHLHREQREYLDQLNALRREKQKLVEKIMDQYRVLEPGPLPRIKKGSWLADKVKRLMRPRREGGPHGGPRPWVDGAGSTESLGPPSEAELSVGREADGTGSPSPAPMRRAQSSLCLRDETLAGGQRRKLSSRFPVGRSSESFSAGDTPRQRFRQRRPGPLGSPSPHGKGAGTGWACSVETLAEHEADADREDLSVQEPEKRHLASSLSQ